MNHEPAPLCKLSIQLDPIGPFPGETVVLDPDRMKFNETTLNQYMEHEYGWLDYFGKKLEQANAILFKAEIEYENKYAQLFDQYKTDGCTEKQSEFRAKGQDVLFQLKEKIGDTKLKASLINRHLMAWNKNHENVQNRGHNLRKELDKLNKDIYRVGLDADTEQRVHDIIG